MPSNALLPILSNKKTHKSPSTSKTQNRVRHHGTAHDGCMQICCFDNEAEGVGWRRFSVPEFGRRIQWSSGTEGQVWVSKAQETCDTENNIKPCMFTFDAQSLQTHVNTDYHKNSELAVGVSRFHTCSCGKGSSRMEVALVALVAVKVIVSVAAVVE